MTTFSRSLAVVLLVCFAISMLPGCGQPRPQPLLEPQVLEKIETKVPKLTDLPLKQAETILTFVALKVGKVTLEDTKDPSLHTRVFDQSPSPGTPVRGGTPVDVRVYAYRLPSPEGRGLLEKAK